MKGEKEILSYGIAEMAAHEYRCLLSIGKSPEEAEKIIVDYCMPQIESESPEEGCLWLALALTQWQKGCLSAAVKEKAIQWIPRMGDGISAATLCTLEETLSMPMKPAKRSRRPWIQHCPWPEGSLLAYKIISSDHPHSRLSPFYGKYVLLQISCIKKWPISRLCPDEAWNESMLVRLYDWYGDNIPKIDEVKNLELTPIKISQPSLGGAGAAYLKQAASLPGMPEDKMQELITRLTQPSVEECCALDWTVLKRVSNRKEVFTYLGLDPNHSEDEALRLRDLPITAYSLSHSIPFDAMLVNRLYQLYGSKPE